MEESIKELAYTQASSIRGDVLSTSYELQGVLFLKKIKDAAKKRLYFQQACYITSAPKGTKDVIIPRRTAYLGSSGVTAVVAEADSDITTTTLDNLDGVVITPVMSLARIAITNYALRVSTLELMKAAQEELIYSIGDRVDSAIAVKFGDATAATTSARGTQKILGGDATTCDTLANGDILTTDIIAKARRYLISTKCMYWSGGSEGTCSQGKNPWTEGHMLFIAPEQEECLMKDSQFVNAAEFGGREVVLNGQIARYLGIDIIVAPNVESAAGGALAPDATTMTAGVDMHRCIMTSKGNGGALVWGLEPQLNIVPRPERSQQQIILESAYATGIIHDDAIVWIDVTDI
jgi:N4-gp56 family major capsid protein